MKIKDLRFTYGGYAEVARYIGDILNPTEVPVYTGYFAIMPPYYDEYEIKQIIALTPEQARIGKASIKIILE